MNYDKITYLFWSGFVLVLIFATSILSNYGKSFIEDDTFQMFFSWFIALVIINLFNILMNLIYHYFMKDLEGPRGLKGEIGDRGLPGKDDKCACDTQRTAPVFSDGYEIEEADKLEVKTFGEGGDFQISELAPGTTGSAVLYGPAS